MAQATKAGVTLTTRGAVDPPEPHIVQIADGVWAQAEDRSVTLPRHLSDHDGRIRTCSCVPLLRALTAVTHRPAPVHGTRLECRDQHELVVWMTGRLGTADLKLSVCRFCGMVEVRDVSLALIVDEDDTGRRQFITPLESARRRDTVLGWYAGRRVSGRTYA